MQKINQYFAFKIKDGLYIGNQRASNEKDFITQNKITHVVNCAGSQVKVNPILGMKLLSFDWLDVDEQVLYYFYFEVILDDANKNINSIYNFIEEASEDAEGTLICSFRGQSRALTIITAYLMKKLRWSLYKTLQFMNSKRLDFEIRAIFLKQLLGYEGRLYAQTYCSKDWQDKSEQGEALLVRNTYLNAQLKGMDPNSTQKKKSKNGQKQILTWKKDLSEIINESSPAKSNSFEYFHVQVPPVKVSVRDTTKKRSRSTIQGFRNSSQPKALNHFQPKILQKQPVRSSTPNPNSYKNLANARQIFDVYLENVAQTPLPKQFFESSSIIKNISRPRQLTPIQTNSNGTRSDQMRSASQNNKSFDLDSESIIFKSNFSQLSFNASVKSQKLRRNLFQIKR